MNKKLSHTEIEALDFAVDESNGCAFSLSNMQISTVNYFLPPDCDYFNLLSASAVMYKSLSLNFKSLEVIKEAVNNVLVNMPVEVEEHATALKVFAAQLEKAVTDIQNGILLAQQVAQNGLTQTANTLNKTGIH